MVHKNYSNVIYTSEYRQSIFSLSTKMKIVSKINITVFFVNDSNRLQKNYIRDKDKSNYKSLWNSDWWVWQHSTNSIQSKVTQKERKTNNNEIVWSGGACYFYTATYVVIIRISPNEIYIRLSKVIV